MVIWHKCHQCGKYMVEEKMRMFSDEVFVCFAHEHVDKLHRWWMKVKPQDLPKPNPFCAEDLNIPIDLRRCPKEWYAYTFDPGGKVDFRSKKDRGTRSEAK
jgi:hypothetical protein